MIEIYAAILGASIGIAGMSVSGLVRRTSDSSEAVIRLSVGLLLIDLGISSRAAALADYVN